MLPVLSGGFTSSGRDKSVLSTAIKQLRRRFGRKLRRLLRKHRLLFIVLVVGCSLLWWFRRAVKLDPLAPLTVCVRTATRTRSLSLVALISHAESTETRPDPSYCCAVGPFKLTA